MSKKTDTRMKNKNWDVDRCHTSGRAATALLMDIRDELQTLNRLLGCQNFIGLPRVLQSTLREVHGLRRDLKKPKS